jgi:hypothetical protein
MSPSLQQRMFPCARGASALVFALALSSCATLDARPRAAESSAGCARAALGDVAVRGELDDKRAHCLAAARIAQRCSVAEAVLASYAKELADLFGAGNAAFADLRADHAGIRCARTPDTHGDLATCCEANGF